MFMPSGAAAAASINLEASANPVAVSAISPTVPMTTNSTTVTASGGTPPYSYAWVRTDVLGETVVATAPSSNVTAFRLETDINVNEPLSTTWECTVTDAALREVKVPVGAEFTKIV